MDAGITPSNKDFLLIPVGERLISMQLYFLINLIAKHIKTIAKHIKTTAVTPIIKITFETDISNNVTSLYLL